MKTRAVPVNPRWREVETEEHKTDQLSKPGAGELNPVAPQRRSGRVTRDLAHTNVPTWPTPLESMGHRSVDPLLVCEGSDRVGRGRPICGAYQPDSCPNPYETGSGSFKVDV